MTAAGMRSLSSSVAAGLLGVAILVAPMAPAGAVSLVPPPPSETAPDETAQAATAPDDSYVDSRLLAIGAGAVVSIVAFNMLAAPLGTVPLAGGALEAVPYSVALGSRLIAAVSAGTGAISAAWMYDAWAGTKSDYRYLLALGAGAVAGVAVGNYLALGELGWPPYYVGAGEEAAGTLASTAAQAASRVYVIATAVFGAWAADYIYRH
jgi:hypothetical protein